MSGLRHYQYIDALRGFAFLGVLTVHASEQVPSFPGRKIALAGEYGVQLFFLLSAVTLLRSVSLRTSKEQFPVRNFFIRRFFRIAPLFWFGIAFYYLLDGCRAQYWAPNGLGPWQFATTLFFLHGWSPATINSVVPGGWSIAVEMTFYLCLPFLANRITSIWSALSVGFYTLVISVVLNRILAPELTRLVPADEQYLVPPFLYFWFPSQLPIFLLGFAVYYSLHNKAVISFLGMPGRPFVLLIMAIYGLFALTRMQSGRWIPLPVCYAVVFSMIILALASHPFKLFVNTFASGLGVISFSCYITHFVALRITAHLITSDHFAFLPPNLASFMHFLEVWFTGLILTVAASSLTYFVIEKPGMAIGSFIIRRNGTQSGPTKLGQRASADTLPRM